MDTFRIEKQILRLVKCNYNYGKEVDLQSWNTKGTPSWFSTDYGRREGRQDGKVLTCSLEGTLLRRSAGAE